MNPPRHAPMACFPVRDGEILVGGLPLSRLAARIGAEAPFYAYDRSLISDRINRLRAALPQRVKLHYAIKANPMPALVCHVAARVDGLDVASGRELRLALDSGMDPQAISFAGPGKSETELVQAVAAGILVQVESFRELPLLAEASRRLGLPARVAVRINPNFELKNSGMKMGGGPRQFGVDAEAIPALLADIRHRELAFEGFHIYSGSQNLRAEAICEAQAQAVDLALRLAWDGGLPIRRLNVGGGFGIPYFPGEAPLDLSPIGPHLEKLITRVEAHHPGAEVTLELGRYLVGEAGIYVCRVVDRKISRGLVHLITDGGLHHHLAASGNFGQVIRKNYPVAIGNRMMPDAPQETVSIVGPLCTPLDLLAERVELPIAQPGDFVVVFQSGAYGRSASPLDFLSHPPPLEVLA